MRPCPNTNTGSMARLLLLAGLLWPLLARGRGEADLCSPATRTKYCEAWHGGDYHTACQWCGRGLSCPQGEVSGRIIQDPRIR